MSLKSRMQRASFQYAVFGAAFGALFPATALVVSILIGRPLDLLFWIICTAPVFLGIFAHFAGSRQDNLNVTNQNLERRVEERTNAIQAMLNVTEQGFLSFGPDYRVRPEYSRECERLLGPDIAGRRLPDLLFSDEQIRADFVDGLDIYFAGKAKGEVIFDLLEHETRLGESIVEIEYRTIDDETVMCTLTDVTSARQLEFQLQEEEHNRNLILRVATHRKYFSRFIDEAHEVLRELDSLLAEEVEEVLRKLHTFKSNAHFLGFERTGNTAHELETTIGDHAVLGQVADISDTLLELRKNFHGELDVVSSTLGEQWVKDLSSVTVPVQRIRNLEQYMQLQYPKDGRLRSAVSQLRAVPLVSLFSRFPDMIQDVAEARAKRVKPLEIVGGNFSVIPENYESLVNALTHVVRNMVDHGIESPMAREVQGKDQAGNIRLVIKDSLQAMEIILSDDGQGIGLKQVEQRARERGLLSGDTRPTKRQLLTLLFRSGFSTAEAVTTVSGRGVGLSVVREAVRDLDGRIGVETQAGRGTTFRIVIPHKNRKVS